MVTLYVTKPKNEIYNAPYSGKDKKEALLKIIDTYAKKKRMKQLKLQKI